MKFHIVKEIHAKSFKDALKNEPKGEVIDIRKMEEPKTDTYAVGFVADFNKEDDE